MKGLKYTKKELNKHHLWVVKALTFMDKEIAKLDKLDGELRSWREVKREMSKLSSRLKEDTDVPKKMADVVVFSALEEAIDKEKGQLCRKFQSLVEDWWDSLPLHHAPIYHEVMNVGFDMAKGYSEREARKFHTEWLDDHEVNRMYDGYYYAPDGTVVNMSQATTIGEA